MAGDERVLQAWRQLRQGAVGEAHTALEAVAEDHLDDLDRAHRLAGLVEARLARGEVTAATVLADRLASHVAPHLPAGARAVAHHARADLAAALADLDASLLHHEEAARLVPDPDPEWLPWRAGLAVALVRAGRSREAERSAARYLDDAQASGSAWATGHALRVWAAVSPGQDREALLEQALEVLTGSPLARLRAQVETDLAGLLVLSPATTARAVRLLRSAESYAGRHDLHPLLGRVRRLLQHAGQVPRPARSEALALLTATEGRVALLAAEGRSNRQLAEELVVTVKAVEWHLSHVYRKLGIRSRRELGRALGL